MESFFDSGMPTPKQIREDIDTQGYAIYPNAIRASVMEELKQFWRQYFRSVKVSRKPLRGNIRLGEKNFCSYTDNREWCIYRDFDFLWNPPCHLLTREIGVAVHRIRNRAQGYNENYGLEYDPSNYGIYLSTSRYPCGGGRLRAHTDQHADTPIVQYMLPITYRGEEYTSGGLFLRDKTGATIDVEERIQPGSLIFFDGRLEHEVKAVQGDGLGRIASFAIPTFFKSQEDLPEVLRLTEKFYFGVQRRVRQWVHGKPIEGARY